MLCSRRVSCEAIPEEIFGMGTTPPSSEHTGDHPNALRSQRSYPGATQVTQTVSSATSSTVPPSPTTVQVDDANDAIGKKRTAKVIDLCYFRRREITRGYKHVPRKYSHPL